MANLKDKKKKVVIVDDDEDLLKMMVYAFKSEGLDVKTVATLKEAQGYLLNEKNLESTHLLVLDRMLPDGDGLSILKELRQKYPEKVPLVIVLSVLASEKDVIGGLEAGAVEYMTKPFSLEELLERARALLSRVK